VQEPRENLSKYSWSQYRDYNPKTSNLEAGILNIVYIEFETLQFKFIPQHKDVTAHCIGRWVGPRSSLIVVPK